MKRFSLTRIYGSSEKRRGRSLKLRSPLALRWRTRTFFVTLSKTLLSLFHPRTFPPPLKGRGLEYRGNTRSVGSQ